MNNRFIYATVLVLGFIALFMMRTENDSTKKRVYISQVAEHPALNATVKGIVDELVSQGFDSSTCEISVDSAQAQMGLASQIATKFIAQKPSVVVGVGTLSAQSFLKYIKNDTVPLVFSSVTDPIGAQLLDQKGENVAPVYGVSNFVPLEPQLELFKEIQPTLQKLGILYNPSELNSVSLVNSLQKICPRYGIQLVTQVLTSTADAMQAATQLATQVDAIFISNDSTALSALRTIIMATDKAKIPTYVSDTDAVELGALAALGPNQYQLGRQTGLMIAKLLRKEPVTQQLEYSIDVECYLNVQAAQKLGIIIPQHLIDGAAAVIGTGVA